MRRVRATPPSLPHACRCRRLTSLARHADRPCRSFHYQARAGGRSTGRAAQLPPWSIEESLTIRRRSLGISVSGEGGAVPVSSTKPGGGERDDTRQDVIGFQVVSVF
jgi:hypothetical protein